MILICFHRYLIDKYISIFSWNSFYFDLCWPFKWKISSYSYKACLIVHVTLIYVFELFLNEMFSCFFVCFHEMFSLASLAFCIKIFSKLAWAACLLLLLLLRQHQAAWLIWAISFPQLMCSFKYLMRGLTLLE